MPNFILGMNAKIYYGDAGDALGALLELSNVRDVTSNMEAGESDVTTRANNGWRATAPTLRELNIEFEMVWKTSDAGFVKIRDTFLSNGTLELAVLDQDKATPDAQGPKGSFSIISFSRAEPLEEAIMVSVSAKLETYDQWIEV